jgi:hypothetical protein
LIDSDGRGRVERPRYQMSDIPYARNVFVVGHEDDPLDGGPCDEDAVERIRW